MAATLAEQLTSVQAAIAAVESSGQSIGASGQNWTQADLGVLYAREESLLRRIDKAAAGGIDRTVAEF